MHRLWVILPDSLCTSWVQDELFHRSVDFFQHHRLSRSRVTRCGVLEMPELRRNLRYLERVTEPVCGSGRGACVAPQAAHLLSTASGARVHGRIMRFIAGSVNRMRSIYKRGDRAALLSM